MEESNYDEIIERRRERRHQEKMRRRRKVMLMYLLILAAVLGAAVLGYGLLHSQKGPERSIGQVASKSSADETARTDSGKEEQTDGITEEDSEGGIRTLLGWLRRAFVRSDKGLVLENGMVLTPEQKKNMEEAEGLKEEPMPGENAPDEDRTASAGEEDANLTTPEGRLDHLLSRAGRLAVGYDYDGAIALLRSDSEFSDHARAAEAIAGYEDQKSALVEQDVNQITHVFFHSLIMDTAKAFDGDSRANGYNQVMTTKDEFEKILNIMYDRGYVLVRLHDIAHEETDENGVTKMVKGKILLPEGKKAFVMSQDDVCYYPYMDGDGFAKRIVIGADGKPTCEMVQEDGSVTTGSYDLVPLLEDFIEEHPDFSYKGARAVIAFTGYEGILGYRTASSYQEQNPDYEADCQAAAQVAQCLRDNGWELASHSWGHRYLGQIDFDSFRIDTDKWEAEVESLIGPTDIILYPFGDDISDWHPYSAENERFAYLHEKGFRYFCNVDSSPYWVQIGDDYMRQGRRNLDGYRMWQDISADQEGGIGKRRLDDLFRAEDVFDPARPTPVVWN